MSGGKICHAKKYLVYKKKKLTGRFVFGPTGEDTCWSKCPAHFFTYRNDWQSAKDLLHTNEM